MISRLKKVAERSGNIFFAYHGTDRSNIEDIKSQGLKPSDDGFVYLTYNQELAGSYYSNHHDDPVIIKIQLSSKNIEDIKEYNYDFSFWSIAQEYFEANILNSNAFKEIEDEVPYEVSDGVVDFKDYFEGAVEYDYESLAKQWMNEMLEDYMGNNEAELLVKGTIPASQIVEIIS